MNILIAVLLSLAGLVALLLIIAACMKKDYTARAEIIIAVPADEAFNFLKMLRNQDRYNKWVMADPDMRREFRGTDGVLGFVYAWEGKKAGKGEQTITALEEGKRIETQIRFIKPFEATAKLSFVITKLSESQTRVHWLNTSKMKYPLNMLIPMIEKGLSKDMNTSLQRVRVLLEKLS